MRGRAYSVDLRERIVRAVQRGQPHAEVARRFEVSVATVERYARLAREGRGLAPRPRPGRAVVAIGPGALPLLAAQVQEAPDLTLAEHLARWRERHGATHGPASTSTLVRRFRALGITRKKDHRRL